MPQNTKIKKKQKFNIILLGNKSVGKKSIIDRFIYDNFTANKYKSVIGIDYIVQNIISRLQISKLLLQNNARLEHFYSLPPNYIRYSQTAIIYYDVTSKIKLTIILKRSTIIQDLQTWIEAIREERGDEVFIYILANIIYFEQQRIISTQYAKTKSKELGTYYSEVLAKSGIFIKLTFDFLRHQIEIQQQQQQPQQLLNPYLREQQLQLQQQQQNYTQQLKLNFAKENRRQGGGCF